MKKFMDENFLLQTKAAQTLYHDHAKVVPIIDFHNHLNPQEIYEDRQFSDISALWLGHDHYKWRALRAFGVPEEHITGGADAFTKFSAYAGMMPYAIGNPLFHWTHLELQRYFDIDVVLNEKNARAVYDKCNELLQRPDYSVRNLLLKMNIEALCTTDDPLSDLQYHKALKEEGFAVRVLPTFRPERAMAIEKIDFGDYIAELSAYAPQQTIRNIGDLEAALYNRMTYFKDWTVKSLPELIPSVPMPPYRRPWQALRSVLRKDVTTKAICCLIWAKPIMSWAGSCNCTSVPCATIRSGCLLVWERIPVMIQWMTLTMRNSCPAC
jgi:glucuronate isomerase